MGIQEEDVLGGVLVTLISVGIAGGLSYVLFRLIAPKGSTITPIDVGKQWMAWGVAMATLFNAPTFIRTWQVNPLGKWILILVLWGTMAFMGGWVYGKFFKKDGSGTV